MAAQLQSSEGPHGMSLRRGQLQWSWPRSTPVPLLFSAHCNFLESHGSTGALVEDRFAEASCSVGGHVRRLFLCSSVLTATSGPHRIHGAYR